MSTIRVNGVRFRIHPQDHPPRHVHARYAEAAVIVDLRQDGTVGLADRVDAVIPSNAKRNHIRKILDTAAEHFEELAIAWERMH